MENASYNVTLSNLIGSVMWKKKYGVHKDFLIDISLFLHYSYHFKDFLKLVKETQNLGASDIFISII